MNNNQSLNLLISRDGMEIPISKEASYMSDFFGGFEGKFSVVNVDGKILKKVVEYMEYHSGINKGNFSKLKIFDSLYVNDEVGVLVDVCLAANYMDIKQLLELMITTFRKMISGKTPEEVAKIFNVEL